MLPLIAGPGQVCQLLLQKTAGLAHAGDHAVQSAELRAVAFFNEIQPPRERRALRSQILDRRVNTILAAVEQAVVFEDFSRQLVQSVGIAACVVDSAAKARRATCYLQHEAAGVARAPERLAGSDRRDAANAARDIDPRGFDRGSEQILLRASARNRDCRGSAVAIGGDAQHAGGLHYVYGAQQGQ